MRQSHGTEWKVHGKELSRHQPGTQSSLPSIHLYGISRCWCSSSPACIYPVLQSSFWCLYFVSCDLSSMQRHLISRRTFPQAHFLLLVLRACFGVNLQDWFRSPLGYQDPFSQSLTVMIEQITFQTGGCGWNHVTLLASLDGFPLCQVTDCSWTGNYLSSAFPLMLWEALSQHTWNRNPTGTWSLMAI